MEYPRKPQQNRNPMNIRAHTVRVIDEDGQTLGIMPLREAQDLAQSKGLDLIEVTADAQPPVCRIADYGRLKYQEQKKKAEVKKKQKVTLLKEIQLRPHIQEHDYQVKLNHAKGFLQDRDKVKVCLQFRGREIAFAEAGRKTIDRFIEDLTLMGKVESPPKMEGRRIIAIIAPLKISEMEAALPKQTAVLEGEGEKKSEGAEE